MFYSKTIVLAALMAIFTTGTLFTTNSVADDKGKICNICGWRIFKRHKDCEKLKEYDPQGIKQTDPPKLQQVKKNNRVDRLRVVTDNYHLRNTSGVISRRPLEESRTIRLPVADTPSLHGRPLRCDGSEKCNHCREFKMRVPEMRLDQGRHSHRKNSSGGTNLFQKYPGDGPLDPHRPPVRKP